MARTNHLTTSQPYQVIDTIKTLGRNLRTARVRRNMTIAEASERIGTGVRAVRDAEHGKATTSIAVYMALLWLYDLLPADYRLADPEFDTEGKRLASLREPTKAYPIRSIDNDF